MEQALNDVPHSQYGYWIEPTGIIHAMDRLMAHEDWLSRDGRFHDIGNVSAIELAIRAGWIGVSISPVGESVGVRLRAGSAEKKAARALGRVFRQDGLFEREVYTDFASWTGRDLHNHLVRTGFNPDIFADVAADIRFTEQQIAERQEEVALAEALASARSEGNPPDMRRLRELATEIDDIAGKAHSETGRSIPLESRNGSLEELRSYCRQQIEMFDRYRLDLEKPISELPFALAGTPKPVITSEPDHLDLIDRSLPELEVLQQLKEVDLALATRISPSSSPSGNHENLPDTGEVRRIVEKIETGCGILVSSKLKLLEKAVADVDATRDGLEMASRYYIGHELARTFSVCGGMYVKELRQALEALDTGSSPTP